MPLDPESPITFDEFSLQFPGRLFGHRKRDNGAVDGQPLFYRVGTAESNGIRITLRGDLREAILSGGDGFIGVRRGRGYLVPLSLIGQWLGGKLRQQTVDVTIDLLSGQLSGPGVAPIDVSRYVGNPP
jgi:hypothetical protein